MSSRPQTLMQTRRGKRQAEDDDVTPGQTANIAMADMEHPRKRQKLDNGPIKGAEIEKEVTRAQQSRSPTDSVLSDTCEPQDGGNDNPVELPAEPAEKVASGHHDSKAQASRKLDTNGRSCGSADSGTTTPENKGSKSTSSINDDSKPTVAVTAAVTRARSKQAATKKSRPQSKVNAGSGSFSRGTAKGEAKSNSKIKTEEAKHTKPTPPPTNRISKTRKAKSKSKPKKEVTEDTTPPPPPTKRINKNLKAKINRIVDWINTGGLENSVLVTSPVNPAHTLVLESTLIGALMAMHTDWEISPPHMASLLDVSEAIVDEFERAIGTHQVPVKVLVLDLNKKLPFVEEIQQRIQGNNAVVEEINLVRAELEMHQRRLDEYAAVKMMEACETPSGKKSEDGSQVLDTQHVESQQHTIGEQVQMGQDEKQDEEVAAVDGERVDDEGCNVAVSGKISDVVEEDAEKHADKEVEDIGEDGKIAANTDTNTTAPDKETDRVGVCPAPMMEI